MTDTLTALPAAITAGNSLDFLISLDDYPAGDGWSLSYTLLNSSTKITLSSSEDDDDHSFSIAAATTAAYTAGEYKYTALVTDGTDRHTVFSGSVEILPDPEAQTTYDGRSYDEQMVDALKSLLLGKAGKDVSSYSIHGRSLSTLPVEEVREWLSYYEARVRVAKIKAGEIKRKPVKARFVNAS